MRVMSTLSPNRAIVTHGVESVARQHVHSSNGRLVHADRPGLQLLLHARAARTTPARGRASPLIVQQSSLNASADRITAEEQAGRSDPEGNRACRPRDQPPHLEGCAPRQPLDGALRLPLPVRFQRRGRAAGSDAGPSHAPRETMPMAMRGSATWSRTTRRPATRRWASRIRRRGCKARSLRGRTTRSTGSN